MDSLTFIAKVVESVAWPVTLLFLFFMLRKPITSLIPSIRKLKYKELDLSFGNDVNELREQAAKYIPAASSPTPSDSGNEDRLLRLTEHSSRAAIMEAWLAIESAARQTLAKMGWTFNPDALASPFVNVTDMLKNKNVLDENGVRIYDRLRDLRNSVAHEEGFRVNQDDAVEYVLLASRLIRYFQEKS